MHPKIELLENLFSEAKNDSAYIEKFFDELWLEGATLPTAERRNVTERAVEFVKNNVPLNPKNIALSQLAFGFISFHEGNYEKSLLELAVAQKLFSEIRDEDGMKAVAVMEGVNYRTLGELELALKSLLDAYQQLSKTGEYKTFMLFCTYNLAEIYSETGQYDEALRFHQLNIQLCRKADNQHLLARTLNGIGVVYQHQRNYANALDFLRQSLELTEQINNMPVKARALTDLGNYYFEMGDFVKAADYQNQALGIRQEMKIPNGAVTNLIHLAEISLKQNNPDSSILLLNDALKIAEDIKVKAKVYQIHELMSDIYQSKGDLLTSNFHFRAYHRIREEVQHEDNEKKIKHLQLIFEAEQTKKENIIIKRQKEEIEKKNIALQETIDELTIAKIGRKARAITLIIAIVLFIIEDNILYFALHLVATNNYFISLVVKMVIIFSLSPINKAVETYLLKKVIKKKKREVIL